MLGNLLEEAMGVQNVKDGESHQYTPDSSAPPYMRSYALAIASGTFLDSDTVDGIEAVTASKASANKLVATGPGGYLPYGIIPPPGGVTTGGSAPVYFGVPQLSIVLLSNNLASYGLLTADTDGTLNLTATNSTNFTTITYLSNSISTYWITFSASDTVLMTQKSNLTSSTTGITLIDTNFKMWGISVDPDGDLRTTSLGSI